MNCMNKEAWYHLIEALYAEYGAYYYSVLSKINRNSSLIEDAIQCAFEKMLVKQPLAPTQIEDMNRWATVVCKNEMRSLLRSEARRNCKAAMPLENVSEDERFEETRIRFQPEAFFDYKEECTALVHSVQALSPCNRNLLRLYLDDRITSYDAAKMLKVSRSAVSMRYHRLIKLLKPMTEA